MVECLTNKLDNIVECDKTDMITYYCKNVIIRPILTQMIRITLSYRLSLKNNEVSVSDSQFKD